MADIDGGALSFKSVMDNSQLNGAIDESLRRIKGLSDGTASSGKSMDTTFKITAGNIEQAFKQIDQMTDMHKSAIRQLEQEYQALSAQSSKAFMSGNDSEYGKINQRMQAIKGEITTREKLLQEIAAQADALSQEEQRNTSNASKVNAASGSYESFRSQLMNVKNEMRQLQAAGQQNSQEYENARQKVIELTRAMNACTKQTKILASPTAGFQGVLSGISGVTGAFSVATGVMGLYAGENANLQKIMTKVQSLMTITIGLQQIETTMNKNSAFQLVTVAKAKEWWANVVAKANAAETEETATMAANAAAKEANATATATSTAGTVAATTATAAETTAATAGTVANTGLAGSFKLIGTAIKSIPLIGWIIAGISAIIAIYISWSNKVAATKKVHDDFVKSVVDGCYKSIGSIGALSAKYTALGNNMNAKKQFIKENKKAFDDLGVSVLDVRDAENLLIANKNRFINAQIAKAKAAAYTTMAMDKVKDLLKKQDEYNAMPNKVKKTVTNRSTGGDSYEYYVPNEDKKKKKKELDDLNAEIKMGYQNAMTEEKNSAYNLKKAGIQGAGEYRSGTVGAYQKAIEAKEDALKNISNPKEYKKAEAQIESLKKKVASITGESTATTPKVKATGGHTTSEKDDPFLKRLEAYKTQYSRFEKWLQSDDATVREAAKTEFAGLIKEAASYMDYLKKQRDAIMSVPSEKRTKTQNKQLGQLNDAIADETKKSTVDSFNEDLRNEMTQAKSVLDMLNIIAEKRKAISGDKTKVGDDERAALDEAEKDAVEKQREQTQQLMDEYSSYLDKKIQRDKKYFDDLALLEAAKKNAKTDDEKNAAQRAIDNRTAKYNIDSKKTGDTDYDAMLEQYGTFEQRKQAIIDEYDAKRRDAALHNDTDLINKLNDAQAKAISALANSDLMNSDAWTNLFGNLDELTANEIQKLLDEIESKFGQLSKSFNPVDLNAIRSKLNQAKQILISDNPFKQLGVALKAIFKTGGDGSKDTAVKIKTNWKNLASATEGCFKFVDDAVNSCQPLKDAIGDVGATAISSLSAVVSTSIAVASAIKTAEKASVVLAIIQAALVVVNAISSIFTSIFNAKDKKLDKDIQKHQENIDNLKNAYKQLEWQITKTLGTAIYKNQKAEIANMRQQQRELTQMWNDEIAKKKTDWGKVNEYKEQYAELTREIADMIDTIKEELMGTDVKSIANDLGDAIMSAFEAGTNSAVAWGTKVKEIVKDIIKNLIIQDVIQQPVANLINSYMSKWVGDDGSLKLSLEQMELQALELGDKLDAMGGNIASILNSLPDSIKSYLTSTSTNDESLTGSVKGVSEETASIIGGQLNAMRINQVESIVVIRQQLAVLNVIATNTAFNSHLQKLDTIVTILQNNSTDSLRSQGLS